MMAAQVTTEPGVGARAARKRERRRLILVLVAGALGGVAGAMVGGGANGVGTLFSDAPIPAPIAIMAAILLVGAISAGSHFYAREIDEVEQSQRSRAMKLALSDMCSPTSPGIFSGAPGWCLNPRTS